MRDVLCVEGEIGVSFQSSVLRSAFGLIWSGPSRLLSAACKLQDFSVVGETSRSVAGQALLTLPDPLSPSPAVQVHCEPTVRGC